MCRIAAHDATLSGVLAVIERAGLRMIPCAGMCLEDMLEGRALSRFARFFIAVGFYVQCHVVNSTTMFQSLRRCRGGAVRGLLLLWLLLWAARLGHRLARHAAPARLLFLLAYLSNL